MVNAITPLTALQFYPWLTTPHPSHNYIQKPVCPVVTGTAQRKQMTNITTIYSKANHGLTMGYTSRWFVWIPGSVTMVKL